YRSQRRQPNATAKHHDVLPPGLQPEPDPQRPDNVAIIAGLECRHAVGATSSALVQKFQIAGFAVDPEHALRTSQPEVAIVRRWAKNIEELARLCRKCLGRSAQYQML